MGGGGGGGEWGLGGKEGGGGGRGSEGERGGVRLPYFFFSSSFRLRLLFLYHEGRPGMSVVDGWGGVGVGWGSGGESDYHFCSSSLFSFFLFFPPSARPLSSTP